MVAEGGVETVSVGSAFVEGGEEGRVEGEKVIGVFFDEVEEVTWANEELGRIHERKRRVEENRSSDRGQRQRFLERLDSISLIWSRPEERAVKECWKRSGTDVRKLCLKL